MWKPITEAIDAGNTTGQLGIVGGFLADEAARLSGKLLESMIEGEAFGK